MPSPELFLDHFFARHRETPFSEVFFPPPVDCHGQPWFPKVKRFPSSIFLCFYELGSVFSLLMIDPGVRGLPSLCPLEEFRGLRAIRVSQSFASLLRPKYVEALGFLELRPITVPLPDPDLKAS